MNPTEFLRRLRYWLRRDALARDLEEEMRLHVEMRAESMSDKMGARRRFGNRTSLLQQSRDEWGFGSLEDFTSDVKFAIRRLRRRPAFTGAVVGVMALGIGATTAMFSAVDAAMLRPLPFHNPHELVTLSVITVPQAPGPNGPAPGAHMFDLTDARQLKTVFADVAAYASGGVNLADPDNPVRLNAGVVTANFFATLGAMAFRGRLFVDGDGHPDAPNVVVLSYGLWQRRFGGRDVTGLRIMLNTTSYEVVGVAPPRFGFPGESDLWIPLSVPSTAQTFSAFRNFSSISVVGRLASNTTVKTASAQLLERLQQSRASLGESRHLNIDDRIEAAQVRGVVRPLQQELLGDRRTALFVLLGATGLLLLVASVNVTNLLLSHATLRHRELAVRQSLGATRLRLVRQLLTESVALSLAGAIVGIALAPVALRAMRSLMPEALAGVAPATIDLRVLGFAILLALVTGIAFGLWPAIGATGHSTTDTIKSGGGHGATAAQSGRLRRALVSVELALTVTLLVGAGLMLRSFAELASRDTGMRPANVGTLELAVPKTAALGQADVSRHLNAIIEQLSATPGITAAGVVNDLPLSGVGGIGLGIETNNPITGKRRRIFPHYLLASADYFKAMGIPLLRGRSFAITDDSIAPRVAIVSDKMAAKWWPGMDPVGHTFRFMDDSVPVTIVGVVADVREARLEDDPDFQMYLPIYADTPRALAVVARGELDEKVLLARMRDAVRAVDRTQAIYNVRMMQDVVGASVAPRRTNTVLIAAFAGIALLLAAVGVFAVVSQSVGHRTRELGIRAALGATGAELMTLISREMIWVTAFGLSVGLAGAWAFSRTLASLMYGVSIHDASTFFVVPIALLIPVALATLIPARRALRVNPADVMRAD